MITLSLLTALGAATFDSHVPAPPPTALVEPSAALRESTREFEVRGDRAYLGGEPVELWGLRCGNALLSQNITERHVRALDTMVAHGINLIGVYVQGSNGGWPNPDAGLNGYTRDGALKADRVGRLGPVTVGAGSGRLAVSARLGAAEVTVA